MFASPHPATPGTRRLLNAMLVLAVIDVVLLVPLVLGLFGIIDTDSYVGPVGMTHGLAFVALIVLAAIGGRQGRWNTSFVVWTVLSGLVGLTVVVDVMLKRELDAQTTPATTG